MKFLLLVALCALLTAAHAFLFSSLATVTLLSLSKPTHGFFGIFRRRRPTLPPVKEKPSPDGPVFPSNFPQGGGFPGFPGGNFYNGYNMNGLQGFGQNSFQPQRQPQFPPSQFSPSQSSQNFPPQPTNMNSMQGMQFNPDDFAGADGFNPDSFQGGDDAPPSMNAEEAESFFTLLAETDESKCISRLVCEMGANPESGGEFGQTIVEIIGSLTDFPAGSKVSEYNEVLSAGRNEGLSACHSQFSSCDDESFQMVKKAQVEDGQGDA